MGIQSEPRITLMEVARGVPGGPVTYQTAARWAVQGVAGVRLESYRVGGRRYTSWPAVSRFLAALNAEPAATPAVAAMA